jgi:hypothetical protein
MKRTLLSLILLAVTCSIYAVSPKILFYGYVVEGNIETMFDKGDSPERLDNVSVSVFHGKEEIKAIQNRKTGFYSLILETGKTYIVKFEKEGFISKIFQIDGSNIPQGEFEEAFKMFTDVTLFPKMNAVDEHTLSSAPVAKCKFNNDAQKLVWDMQYARIAFDHFLRVFAVKDNFSIN